MRRYNDMQFRMFYSPDLSAAALAAPPSIAHVSAQASGNTVQFAIEVNSSDPAANVQAVWVTYSMVNGTAWQSLDLVRNATNPVLWEGTLNLPGTVSAADVRYMVQAASGTGLISLDTNRGAYFIPGIDPGVPTPPTAPNQPAPLTTTLTLIGAPGSGGYASQATFTARLTSNGAPLAGQTLSFGLGTQSLATTTDGNGQASITFLLSDAPGSKTLQVAFAGAAGFEATVLANAFAITKQAAQLALTPTTLSMNEGATSTLTATLTDNVGRGLRELTVLFVVRNGTGVLAYAKAVITDYRGRAVLQVGDAQLAPGNYAVSAYFGDSTPLPGVSLSNAYYQPANTAGTIAIVDITPPDTTMTSGPSSPTPNTSASFVFTGTDGTGLGVARFECKLDSSSFATCTSPKSYTGLANGVHTFAARAIDVANNVDPTPAVFTWTVGPGTYIISCGGYDVFRTSSGQYVAPGWTGTIKVGTTGNDNLSGGSGTDLIVGLGGNDNLVGGSGDDVVCGNEGADTLNGGSGADRLYGGEGNDALIGGSENDVMVGDAGDDSLDGGSGSDTMSGGDGNDTLIGGFDNDVMLGDAGNDRLDAGAGNDILTGGSGADRFNGGSGTDRATDLTLAQNDVNEGGIELFGP